MSYVRSNLIEGEVIFHEGKLSRWIYFLPGLTLLFGLSVLMLVNKLHSPGLFLTAIFLTVTGLMKLSKAFIQRWTTELSVTNKRVIGKTGFIRRKSIDVRLERIESILVNQSIWGRLLDYGDIGVKGSGGTLDSMSGFDDPMLIRKKFMEALEVNKLSP